MTEEIKLVRAIIGPGYHIMTHESSWPSKYGQYFTFHREEDDPDFFGRSIGEIGFNDDGTIIMGIGSGFEGETYDLKDPDFDLDSFIKDIRDRLKTAEPMMMMRRFDD